MEVIFFEHVFRQFVCGLDESSRAKVTRAYELLGERGSMLGMPYSKSLGDGLFELRILDSRQIRLFYAFHNGSAVIIHGYLKKSQHIPSKELRTARRRLGILAGR